MKLLTNQMLQELETVEQSPCLSLYLPTSRSHPDNLQDPIRFKNLVKELEASLVQQYSSGEVTKFIKPFEELLDDKDLWKHTLEGLAVFGGEGIFKVIAMQTSVEELVVVADSFHTKPLRHYLQSVDRYHVLGLSLDEIQLFEGNRHGLVQVELSEDVPTTMKDALGEELTEKHLTVASYGGTSSAMHHGHGGKGAEMDVDAERFFRVITSSIEEKYSKPSGLPLILAALPEHHNLFQKVSSNSKLLEKSIPVNPKSVPLEKLTGMAWEIMEPELMLKFEQLGDQFSTAKANLLGSDDLKEVAVAAAMGKIDTLLIEADKIIGGKLKDVGLGTIEESNIDNPDVDDLLDDLGELVRKKGGTVMVIPADKMPSETGLAAVFRY